MIGLVKFMNIVGFGAIVVTFLMPLMNACSTTAAQTALPKSVYSHSYISYIKLPKYEGDAAKLTFSYFNNLAKRPIITYEGSDSDRPIVIMQHHFTEAENIAYTIDSRIKDEKLVVAGLTISTTMYCNIFISDEIVDEETFKETLIHEYLHCFGFGHTGKKIMDVMSAQAPLEPLPDENYKKYAEKLENLIYGQ